MGRSYNIFSLAYFSFISYTAAAATLHPRNTNLPPQNTLHVDVCILGGGAAGTYAAIKSIDLNKTVAIVERNDRLGGHAHTYTDPGTGQTIELGVVEYEDGPIVRNFFSRFNIPLYKYNFSIPGVTSKYADFSTGLPATPKTGDLEGAWDAFQAQVAKYPFLDYDLGHVPDRVPADLLLPFGDFIRKYKLEDAVPYLSLYGQGWGNFVTLPTLLAVKYFPPYFFSPASLLGGGEGAVAAKRNSLIYEKAREELGASVLLNSTVVSMDRRDPEFVKVKVQTPAGRKLIKAKKLISAIPPVLTNLHAFDLTASERALFSKYRGHSWYVGLITNSSIPSNLSLQNYGTDNTANFNLPLLPGAYDIFATVVPGLHYFLFGGNDSQLSFTRAEVEGGLRDTISRLQAQGTIPKGGAVAETPPLSLIEFSNHSPYEVYVTAEEITRGFYGKVFALQGQRNTYWTGAAWVTHSSAAIWNFTDQLLTKMWE